MLAIEMIVSSVIAKRIEESSSTLPRLNFLKTPMSVVKVLIPSSKKIKPTNLVRGPFFGEKLKEVFY
jgi:hypothetical protein